jgi:muramoyltetrapeptide carboxypeptidase
MPAPTSSEMSTTPAFVTPGASVAIVAPSGPLDAEGELELICDTLRDLDLRPTVVGRMRTGGSTSPDYLAASDTSRLRSLNKALREFDVVLFVRGGYGATRLLEHRGWDRPGPWLVGFSDATALLWARYARGLGGGVHGPVGRALLTEPEWSVARLVSTLKGEAVSPLTLTHMTGPTAPVQGPVLAGNLCVATALIGTPHLPQLRDHLVVFEDVGEPPYKVDRMLTQWRLSGLLDGIAGLVFGTFDAVPQPATLEVIIERTSSLGVPVWFTDTVGHHGVCAAMEIGAQVRATRSALTTLRR